MPRRVGSVGNYAADAESDYTHLRIDNLERTVKTLNGSSAPSSGTVTINAPSSSLVVASSDGAFSASPGRLAFVLSDGFTLAVSGDIVTVAHPFGVPVAIGSANAAGAATTSARSDHVHAGVLSFNGSQGAVSYTAPVTSVNGNTGAVFSDVELRTTDPGTPRSGQHWYRTDLDKLSIYTGSVIKRSAVFT